MFAFKLQRPPAVLAIMREAMMTAVINDDGLPSLTQQSWKSHFKPETNKYSHFPLRFLTASHPAAAGVVLEHNAFNLEVGKRALHIVNQSRVFVFPHAD